MNPEFRGSTQKELLSRREVPLREIYVALRGRGRRSGSSSGSSSSTCFFPGSPARSASGRGRSSTRRFSRRSAGASSSAGTSPSAILTRSRSARTASSMTTSSSTPRARRTTGLRLGNNVYVGRNTILSCKEGDHRHRRSQQHLGQLQPPLRDRDPAGEVLLSRRHCYLVAGGNHSFDDLSTPIMFQPSVSKGGIRIGDDVWLGAGVIVLDGVTIGQGTRSRRRRGGDRFASRVCRGRGQPRAGQSGTGEKKNSSGL